MTCIARLASVAVATAMLLGAGVARADSAKVTFEGNGHAYQRFDRSMGWYQARSFCLAKGGYLATITSPEEQDFVWSQVGLDGPHNGGIWLGGIRRKAGGGFRWITGEPFSYSHWEAGEPNNWPAVPGGGEDYLTFYHASVSTAGTWNDASTYNSGTVWGEGVRQVSTLCEWGGQGEVRNAD